MIYALQFGVCSWITALIMAQNGVVHNVSHGCDLKISSNHLKKQNGMGKINFNSIFYLI